MSKLGVDVSRWQGDIDWQLLADQGVLWAGVRAGVGDYYTDRTFEYNYDTAWAVGILPIPYFVINPNNSVAGQLTRYRISLDGRKPVGTIVDAELPGDVSNTVMRRRYCWFCRDGMNDSQFGSAWMLYSNKSFMETHMKEGYQGWKWSTHLPFWVASYGANNGEVPPTPPFPRMPWQYDKWYAWQYTDKGKLMGGSAADIDLDLMDDNYYANLRVRSGLAEPGGDIPTPPPPTDDPVVLKAGLYRVL